MGNIQEAQSKVTKTLVTETNLHAALKKAKGSGSKLVSWNVKNFTSKGDNYVGVVTSIVVNYILDGSESTVNFIAKLGPSHTNKVLSDGINYAFMKEARVYLELVPVLSTELTSIGLSPLRIPECFYAVWESDKEVIYLQDLRPLGFKTFDRRQCLDRAHVTLVLQELARLHAASLLLQVKDGFEHLDVKYIFLEKDCFDMSEEIIKVTNDTFSGHIEKAIMVLKDSEGYEKAIQWLEKVKSNTFETIAQQLNNNTRFAVVCHGDCWSNNTLFRYDEEGNPIDVMLIDLQLFRRTSLAIDLGYFFHHSLASEDRKDNLENYLDVYYTSFKAVMAAGGLAMPFTRPELYEEYKRKCLYGILWSLTFLPMIVSEESSNDNDDWMATKDSQGSSDSFTKKQKDGSRLMFEKNPKVLSRFLSLFDEIVKRETEDQ